MLLYFLFNIFFVCVCFRLSPPFFFLLSLIQGCLSFVTHQLDQSHQYSQPKTHETISKEARLLWGIELCKGSILTLPKHKRQRSVKIKSKETRSTTKALRSNTEANRIEKSGMSLSLPLLIVHSAKCTCQEIADVNDSNKDQNLSTNTEVDKLHSITYQRWILGVGGTLVKSDDWLKEEINALNAYSGNIDETNNEKTENKEHINSIDDSLNKYELSELLQTCTCRGDNGCACGIEIVLQSKLFQAWRSRTNRSYFHNEVICL